MDFNYGTKKLTGRELRAQGPYEPALETTEVTTMSKSPELIKFIDSVSMSLYGMTISTAHEKRICIDCKSPIRDERGADTTGEPGQIYSEAGWCEYHNSALCETCFDNIMGGN